MVVCNCVSVFGEQHIWLRLTTSSTSSVTHKICMWKWFKNGFFCLMDSVWSMASPMAWWTFGIQHWLWCIVHKGIIMTIKSVLLVFDLPPLGVSMWSSILCSWGRPAEKKNCCCGSDGGANFLFLWNNNNMFCVIKLVVELRSVFTKI